MPIKGPTYKKGEKVTYTSFGRSCEALIVGAHLDDALEPYYTIQLPDGREKQTDDAHLSPLEAMPPTTQGVPPPPPSQVVTPPASHRPTAPMPKDPPPPMEEEELPQPQDEPWDMTGRAHPHKKKQPPPKPEDGLRGRGTKPLQPKVSSSRSHNHGKPNNSQSTEAKRRQQHRQQASQQQQARRHQASQQFDPYSRHYQRGPFTSTRQDPFSSILGGVGRPIRSRL